MIPNHSLPDILSNLKPSKYNNWERKKRNISYTDLFRIFVAMPVIGYGIMIAGHLGMEMSYQVRWKDEL